MSSLEDWSSQQSLHSPWKLKVTQLNLHFWVPCVLSGVYNPWKQRLSLTARTTRMAWGCHWAYRPPRPTTISRRAPRAPLVALSKGSFVYLAGVVTILGRRALSSYLMLLWGGNIPWKKNIYIYNMKNLTNQYDNWLVLNIIEQQEIQHHWTPQNPPFLGVTLTDREVQPESNTSEKSGSRTTS